LKARVLLLTILTLIAFASNSILCRLALAKHEIDPSLFTIIRLLSGTVMLTALVLLRNRTLPIEHMVASRAITLLTYAAAFSFAYLALNASAGALILFGSVQVTMIAGAMLSQHRPTLAQWMGLLLALAGLIYLVAPGLSAPPLLPACLMAVAGISWGCYSLLGRTVTDAVSSTWGAFALATAFGAIAWAIYVRSGAHYIGTNSLEGLALAITSGAITSAVGYVLWYSVLPSLGATRAAVVQLLVPILTAFAAVLFLAETLTSRLIIAGIMTLCGVAIAVIKKN